MAETKKTAPVFRVQEIQQNSPAQKNCYEKQFSLLRNEHISDIAKVVRNSILAVMAALAVRDGLLCIEDYNNKYQNKSAEHLQKMIKTPKEAQKYIEQRYGPSSFCLDSARALACMIADDGYSPEIIAIKEKGCTIHWICAFKCKNKIGFADNGIFGYESAKYPSIEEMINALSKKEHVKLTFEYTKGLLVDDNYFSSKSLENVLKSLEQNRKR